MVGLEDIGEEKEMSNTCRCSFTRYRFNGYDGRLDRQLEAVVMVMEALEGFQDKVEYDVVGHSGETYYIPFVDPKKPPTDDKLRLETIKVNDFAGISSILYITFISFADDARAFTVLLVWGSHAFGDTTFGGGAREGGL